MQCPCVVSRPCLLDLFELFVPPALRCPFVENLNICRKRFLFFIWVTFGFLRHGDKILVSVLWGYDQMGVSVLWGLYFTIYVGGVKSSCQSVNVYKMDYFFLGAGFRLCLCLLRLYFFFSNMIYWEVGRIDKAYQFRLHRALRCLLLLHERLNKSLCCGCDTVWVPMIGPILLNVTWLILPVVICLSQRLSHACLSFETANGSLKQLQFT